MDWIVNVSSVIDSRRILDSIDRLCINQKVDFLHLTSVYGRIGNVLRVKVD